MINETSVIFSKEYTERYRLSAGSTTQRAVKALIDKEIISKNGNVYEIDDPFLKLWLRKVN